MQKLTNIYHLTSGPSIDGVNDVRE